MGGRGGLGGIGEIGGTGRKGVPHWNGNSIYIFLFWEKRGFSPNFHIHVSVSCGPLRASKHIRANVFPLAENKLEKLRSYYAALT
jgi:hypothetical protein